MNERTPVSRIGRETLTPISEDVYEDTVCSDEGGGGVPPFIAIFSVYILPVFSL